MKNNENPIYLKLFLMPSLSSIMPVDTPIKPGKR